MPIIDTSAALAAACERFARRPYVAVDTEFMRETTYWARLCLVQLAADGEAAAIDPLADGIDLDPFYELLARADVVKVFHAARQDLEIFHHERGVLPAPLFDTQVAAMVCGFGDSVGYEKLVRDLTGARVDKSSQFSDWARRPLRPRQVDYALSDVVHLCPVFEKLSAMLKRSGRESWLDEEMATLADPRTYEPPLEDAWRRIKSRNRSGRFLAILRELAAWREGEAQRRDRPRNRVLRDEVLRAIAGEAPRSIAELKQVRSFPRAMAERREAGDILEAVARGLAIDDKEVPRVEPRGAPRASAALIELLRALLRMKSEQHDVAQKLIAGAEDLERIARADGEADVPALHGWRRDLFGEDALALKRGEIALTVRDGRLATVPSR